jgi:oligoribonuclease (3'-5' exoribonuclease)
MVAFSNLSKTYAMKYKLPKCETTIFARCVAISTAKELVPILSTSLTTKLGKVKHTTKVAI